MNGWRLDKHVPIAVVGAILLQAGSTIWWASTVETRISSAVEKINNIETQIRMREQYEREVIGTLARMDERQKQQAEILNKIEAKIK